MKRRAGRWLARAGLTFLLVLSLALTGWSAWRISHDPLLRPLIDRTADEFAAALEREMADAAIPEAVVARLSVLLAEDPRNWIAIQAVEEIVADRGLHLPAAVTEARATAWEEDSGFLAKAGACLACTVNAANCSLSEALICNAPVALTPVGDLIGIGKAAVAAAGGDDIDEFDLALSLIGLGATVAVVATGGTSYHVEGGRLAVEAGPQDEPAAAAPDRADP